MSTRREELVLKLLTQYYLDVPDQAEFGSNTVSLAELATVVRDALKMNVYFPPQAKPWEPGESSYEGAFLEKLEGHRFRVHCQRSYADNPGVCAQRTSQDYDNFESALRAYLRAEWRAAFDGECIAMKLSQK
jgi:hypothetical protein